MVKQIEFKKSLNKVMEWNQLFNKNVKLKKFVKKQKSILNRMKISYGKNIYGKEENKCSCK